MNDPRRRPIDAVGSLDASCCCGSLAIVQPPVLVPSRYGFVAAAIRG